MSDEFLLRCETSSCRDSTATGTTRPGPQIADASLDLTWRGDPSDSGSAAVPVTRTTLGLPVLVLLS